MFQVYVGNYAIVRFNDSQVDNYMDIISEHWLVYLDTELFVNKVTSSSISSYLNELTSVLKLNSFYCLAYEKSSS